MAAISSAPQPRAALVNNARTCPIAWRALLRLTRIFGDILAVNGAFTVVYLWQAEDIRSSGLKFPADFQSTGIFWLLFNLVLVSAFAFAGLYDVRRGASLVDEAYKVFTTMSLVTVLALVLNTILPEFNLANMPWTPGVLALGWLGSTVAAVLVRFLYRHVLNQLRRRGIDSRRVLIVGAREPGRAVWHIIQRVPESGYRVQGFLSDVAAVGSIVEGLPVLGRTSQLGRVVRATRTDEVLIALSGRSRQDLMEIVSLAEDESVEIKVYPDTFQLITNNEVSIGDLSGLPLVSVKNAALDLPWNRALKRSLDIIVASLVVLAASPIMLLIAILIKLSSPGPVFFLQQRVGMDNRPFWMVKFRTMRTDSEKIGPGWTTPNDPRITWIGQFLRRTSLDEFPNFINVLVGEMSVVGPRPEQPHWVEQFRQQIPRYMRRHKEKAGITGWAQINGLRGDTSIEERTRYDLYYIENWSLLFDIKIILRTIVDLLTGKQENAY